MLFYESERAPHHLRNRKIDWQCDQLTKKRAGYRQAGYSKRESLRASSDENVPEQDSPRFFTSGVDVGLGVFDGMSTNFGEKR